MRCLACYTLRLLGFGMLLLGVLPPRGGTRLNRVNNLALIIHLMAFVAFAGLVVPRALR